MKDSVNSYLGITRNLSCEGFCFDSQNSDIKPGDDLELEIRHPQGGSFFSGLGEIVWKEKANKFEYMTGIKFKGMNAAARGKIMDILSTVSNTHDPVLCSKKEKSRRIKDNKKDKLILFGTVMVVCALLLAFSIPLVIERKSKVDVTDSIIATSTDTGDHEVIEKAEPESPLSEAPTVVTGDDEVIEKAEPESPLSEAPIVEKEYYVQVGSWKNPEYAREALEELKGGYPDVYIVVENDFHKVRIPGIRDRGHGDAISKEIEARLNLKPILILKTK